MDDYRLRNENADEIAPIASIPSRERGSGIESQSISALETQTAYTPDIEDIEPSMPDLYLPKHKRKGKRATAVDKQVPEEITAAEPSIDDEVSHGKERVSCSVESRGSNR